MRIPDIIPVSDLRQDTAAVFKKLKDSGEPLVVTQRGRAIAVLLSIDAYEKAENERELLRLLARGDKEASAGDGHTLESVMRDADALLGDGDS